MQKKINHEMKIYGRSACQVFFKLRANDLVRVYLDKKLLSNFGPLIKYCTENRLKYQLMETSEELEKMSSSHHHEGICLVVKKRPTFTLSEFLRRKSGPLVVLENVENPHNIGAIMRSMANFNLKNLLLLDPNPAFTGAAYRTSEGGAESVDIITCENLDSTLAQLKNKGYDILPTSGGKNAKSLYQHKFKTETVLVFGNEGEGLSKSITSNYKDMIKVPGTGNVESLNVSNAAAVIFSEVFHQLYSP